MLKACPNTVRKGVAKLRSPSPSATSPICKLALAAGKERERLLSAELANAHRQLTGSRAAGRRVRKELSRAVERADVLQGVVKDQIHLREVAVSELAQSKAEFDRQIAV